MTDKHEASHLPSVRAGLRPTAREASGRGGGARDQPGKPLTEPDKRTGWRLSAAGSTRTAVPEAGSRQSARVYPALPQALALQRPSDSWRAPISS